MDLPEAAVFVAGGLAVIGVLLLFASGNSRSARAYDRGFRDGRLASREADWVDHKRRMVQDQAHREEDIVPARRQAGQGLAEYALILALIAIVAIIALIYLGTQLSAALSTIGNSV